MSVKTSSRSRTSEKGSGRSQGAGRYGTGSSYRTTSSSRYATTSSRHGTTSSSRYTTTCSRYGTSTSSRYGPSSGSFKYGTKYGGNSGSERHGSKPMKSGNLSPNKSVSWNLKQGNNAQLSTKNNVHYFRRPMMYRPKSPVFNPKNMKSYEFVYSKVVERVFRDCGIWSAKPADVENKSQLAVELQTLPKIMEDLEFIKVLRISKQRPQKSAAKVVRLPEINNSEKLQTNNASDSVAESDGKTISQEATANDDVTKTCVSTAEEVTEDKINGKVTKPNHTQNKYLKVVITKENKQIKAKGGILSMKDGKDPESYDVQNYDQTKVEDFS